MSTWVNVTNAELKSPNPAPVNSDFQFEVSFQSLEDLTLPIHWRLVYVGSADDKSKDQEIEYIELGPVKRGAFKFSFEADAPNFSVLDPDDVWGTTAILFEGSYRDQCFVRVGWYVYNYYPDPLLQEDPPETPILEKMARWINVAEPRVTRFAINWTGECELPPMPPNDAAKAVEQSMESSPEPSGSVASDEMGEDLKEATHSQEMTDGGYQVPNQASQLGNYTPSYNQGFSNGPENIPPFGTATTPFGTPTTSFGTTGMLQAPQDAKFPPSFGPHASLPQSLPNTLPLPQQIPGGWPGINCMVNQGRF